MSDDQQRRQRALAFLQNIELDPADNDAHKTEEISAAEIKSPMSPIANDADYNDEPLRKLSGNFPDMPERTRIALSFLTSLSDPNWQEHIENNTVAFAAQNNAPIDMPESRFSSPIAVNSSQLTSPSTAVNPAITTDGRTTIITAPLEESVKDVDEVVRPLTRSPRNSMTGSQSRLLPEAGTAESSAEALEQSASNVLSTSLPRENTGPSRRLMSISKVKHRRRRRDSVLVVKVHHNRPYSFAAIPRDARIFFTAGPNFHPVAVFSVLRYRDSRESALASQGDKMASMDSVRKREAAQSFAHLLNPAPPGTYDPDEIDDPDLKTGRHKTVITLPSYMVSIIQYARASDLKQELNDQFKQRHENLDPTLTLSKIRNLKLSLLQVSLTENLELSTLAKAYVYFEKLVLLNLVNKSNRKIIGAACFLLAAKVNDHKEVKYAHLLDTIEKILEVSSKAVREREFWVFSKLNFELHIPKEEYMPHLDRVISLLDYNNLQEYLQGKPPPQRELPFI